MRALYLFMALVFSTPVLAEPPARIVGPKIDLHFIEHGISGRIKDSLVFGYQLNSEFGSTVQVRFGNKLLGNQFKKVDGVLVGKIRTFSKRGITHTLKYVSIDKEKARINFELNGKPLVVRIKADAFKNNHFINPVYHIAGKEPLTYAIRGGQACYGCSINLAFMILSAWLSQ